MASSVVVVFLIDDIVIRRYTTLTLWPWPLLHWLRSIDSWFTIIQIVMGGGELREIASVHFVNMDSSRTYSVCIHSLFGGSTWTRGTAVSFMPLATRVRNGKQSYPTGEMETTNKAKTNKKMLRAKTRGFLPSCFHPTAIGWEHR